MKSLNARLRTACEEFRLAVPLDIDVRKSVGITRCPFIRSGNDVAAVFRNLTALGDEALISAALDKNLRLLRWNIVASGPAPSIRIIDAFHGAILSNAAGIVLVQSRPFGARQPDAADANLTKRIAGAGRLLGYPLFDHVIVDAHGYWSLMPLPASRKRIMQGHSQTLAS